MAIAVVTGASRGIGAALADDLHARGFVLALCATSQPSRGGAMCRSLDIGDADAVERFASDVGRELGPIDLWINNAAVLGPIGPLRDTDADEWDRCFRVNVRGAANGTRSFLRHHAEGALLVNIASRAAVSPGAGIAAYSASKAAVVALTLAVAREEQDITALVVLPPSVDTDMQNTLLVQDERAFPDVELSRARQRAGGVLPAPLAARAILDAVLHHNDTDPVIDLTTLAVGA